MDSSVVIDQKELNVCTNIHKQFSGLTLQQAYNATVSVKAYLEIIGDNIDDFNTFIFK